jgi:hypothetical protein
MLLVVVPLPAPELATDSMNRGGDGVTAFDSAD